VRVYEAIGHGYGELRRQDPRIALRVRQALGHEGPVVNVGAGTGSYEPTDVPVVAVEPAEAMLEQRPPAGAPAVRAVSEALPFADGTFAAGMAILTVHHWTDVAQGLAELRRVVRGPVAVLTWDVAIGDDFWMVSEYVPASRTLDRNLPAPTEIAELLGGGELEAVPVPGDCTDGFYAAWWRRPHAYLDPAVRAAISGLARLAPEDVEPGIQRLADDLASGEWRRRHADLLDQNELDAGYRLVVSPGQATASGTCARFTFATISDAG
jgi:SAM-dependent methyltransferase